MKETLDRRISGTARNSMSCILIDPFTAEEAVGGLIIVKALYGQLVSVDGSSDDLVVSHESLQEQL